MADRNISEADLVAISKVFGDEVLGLQEGDISEVLKFCEISDTSPNASSEQRIFDALHTRQEKDGNRRAILAFIRIAMDQEILSEEQERYEERRSALNEALAVCGLEVTQNGVLREPEGAQQLSELAINLWAGRIPLVRTFWLYYFVGGNIASIPWYFESSISGNIALDLQLILWILLSFIYFVIMTVAVWRSAKKYTGPAYWGTLAKGMIIFWAMGITYQMVKGIQVAFGA